MEYLVLVSPITTYHLSQSAFLQTYAVVLVFIHVMVHVYYISPQYEQEPFYHGLLVGDSPIRG